MIAVAAAVVPPEGARCASRWRARCWNNRVAVHETALPPLAGAVLCSLASTLGLRPSAGVLASLLGEIEAELHVFTWLGFVSGLSAPPPTSASTSPRCARTAPSASPRGPSRPCTSSLPVSPACRCRRSFARRGWSSRRTAAHRLGPRDDQRGARRPARRRGRGDAQRPVVVGDPQGRRERRVPGRRAGARRGAPGRARAMAVPLVPRADRQLAVPAVRSPRAPRASSCPGRASAGRPQVGVGARVRPVSGSS